MLRMLAAILPGLSLAVSLAAQDAAVPPQPQPETTTDTATAPAQSSAFVAMSPHERWHGYLHEHLLGTAFVLDVFGSALVSHISRDPQQWGVGVRGYLHRVENRFFIASVDGAVHSSLAAALHHDTRYHRGSGNALHRAGHALERTFVTYDDAGRRVPDVSAIAGIYSGTMLAGYWRPHCCDVLGRGFRAGNSALMAQAGTNLFKEFGPDLKRLLTHK